MLPAARQTSISAARIGLDASWMSVSPRQNFLNPPPVPEMPTVTRTLPRFWIWNSSATASVIGNTVLEPSILITWASAVGATARPANASVAALNSEMIFMCVSTPCGSIATLLSDCEYLVTACGSELPVQVNLVAVIAALRRARRVDEAVVHEIGAVQHPVLGRRIADLEY